MHARWRSVIFTGMQNLGFLPLLPLACSSSQFSISSHLVLDCAIDLCFRRKNVHIYSKLRLLFPITFVWAS